MNSHSAASHASTASVARALGVSISTVKRWVDDGILPADKTAGGHRKVLIADVLDLVRREELPSADLSLLVEPTPRKRRHSSAPSISESMSLRLRDALLEGDAETARALMFGSHHQGVSIAELADRAIAPAMAAIGHAWETGRIDVMQEHLASQICASALYELKATIEKRVRKSWPSAVGAAPEDDYSVLPTLLAQMTLLECGWNAINLGPDLPLDSLLRAIDEVRPRLMWLSVSHLGDSEAFVKQYQVLARQAEKAGVAIAIGGRALVESVRARLRYTAYGDTLAHLSAFARSLNPPPRRPARGRPPTI